MRAHLRADGLPRFPVAAATLASEVVLAHAAYVPEVRHPVEVAASEEQHLVGLAVEAIVDTDQGAVARRPPAISCWADGCCRRRFDGSCADGAADVRERAGPPTLAAGQTRIDQCRDGVPLQSEDGPTRVFYWIDESAVAMRSPVTCRRKNCRRLRAWCIGSSIPDGAHRAVPKCKRAP